MLTAMRVREDVRRVSALIYGYLVQLYVQLYRSATTEPAVSVHGSNSSN